MSSRNLGGKGAVCPTCGVVVSDLVKHIQRMRCREQHRPAVGHGRKE